MYIPLWLPIWLGVGFVFYFVTRLIIKRYPSTGFWRTEAEDYLTILIVSLAMWPIMPFIWFFTILAHYKEQKTKV